MNFSDFKNSKNLLTNEQMKNIKGGDLQTFKCVCGFGVGPDSPLVQVQVNADNVADAAGAMAAVCNGRGSTCWGA